MWHQKDGIGKMYNMIEDNVTWRSTNYTRNVTTKRGTNEINNCQIKYNTVAWHDAMFTVKMVIWNNKYSKISLGTARQCVGKVRK